MDRIVRLQPVAELVRMICRSMINDEDKTFVIASWIDSFKDSHYAGQIHMDDVYDVYWPQIERVISRPHCTVKVASDQDDPSQLFGFIAADVSIKPPILFYVLVKQPHRKWGYARALCESIGFNPAEPFGFTYRTPILTEIADQIPLATWQPMWARFAEGMGIRRIKQTRRPPRERDRPARRRRNQPNS